MHHLTCEISSLLRSLDLILFTFLLVHLILTVPSPTVPLFTLTIYHSLSLSLQIKKPICFTNPFLQSFWFHLDYLRGFGFDWALVFVCYSFSFIFFVYNYTHYRLILQQRQLSSPRSVLSYHTHCYQVNKA